MARALAFLAATLFVSGAMTAAAQGFGFSFDWGDIPLCTSGQPNLVPNPLFELHDVPQGAVSIVFKLTDLDVPGYAHGGGRVRLAGQDLIAPGAFTYKSPCPPSGSHTYEWRATVLDKDGKPIAEARASTRYP
ncbi:MAG TPA: hypothetical protein VIL84_08395 [Devosiaceae bacterium]